MRLTPEQAKLLQEKAGLDKIVYMKIQCIVCGRDNGAMLANRSPRMYMEHIHALFVCKECGEDLQRTVGQYDLPYVNMSKEEEEKYKL